MMAGKGGVERSWPPFLLLAVILALLLASCSSLPAPAERSGNAARLAIENDMASEVIDGGLFRLQSFHRLAVSGSALLTVYIEGDGYAWASRSQPSFDPTPLNPVGLKMAAGHSGGNVAYLARPCQFVKAQNPHCVMAQWTHRRFADDVITSMSQAVDVLKQKAAADRLQLVGFSGGGAIAALLAARRNDVELLVTVAGNLDPVFWADLMHLSPLEGSLNPADFSQQLAGVSQLHLVGGKDDVVPLAVAESYRAAFADASNMHIEVLPEFTHHCCWAEQWPALQATYFSGGK